MGLQHAVSALKTSSGVLLVPVYNVVSLITSRTKNDFRFRIPLSSCSANRPRLLKFLIRIYLIMNLHRFEILTEWKPMKKPAKYFKSRLPSFFGEYTHSLRYFVSVFLLLFILFHFCFLFCFNHQTCLIYSL